MTLRGQNIVEVLDKWRRSVQTRSALAVLITAAVLMETVSAVQYWCAREAIRQEVEHRAESELTAKNLEAEKVTRAAETAARSTVWMLEERLGNPSLLYDAMRHLLSNNPNIVGCGIGFVAGYYPEHGRWFEPYVKRTANDSIVTMQIGGSNHDYLHADWYSHSMQTNRPYWTEPYLDDAGAKEMLVTYTLPVHDASGRTVAVFGVDMSLNWLSQILNARHIYPSSYNVVISRTGKLMACPVESLVMQHTIQQVTGSMNDTSIRNVNRQMMQGASGQTSVTDDNGQKNYIFFAPIARDSTLQDDEQPGWSMAVVCADNEIYAGLRRMSFMLLLLSLAGLMLLGYIMVRSIHSLQRLYKADDEQKRITGELAVAHRIQQAMLPKSTAVSHDINATVCAMLKPARAVGGDFYDYAVHDGCLYFCIGDVAGKGVPAAMVMAMAQATFRMLSAREQKPEQIAVQMNNALTRDNDYNIFITLCTGVLDMATGCLTYCNAGHKPTILISGNATEELPPMPSTLPVGAMPDWPYRAQQVTLPPHSTLFLFTDGLTEAENSHHELFGAERMMQVLQGGGEPSAIIERMTAEVSDFVGDTEQSDDLTMLAIKYEPQDCGSVSHLTLPNDVSHTPQLSDFVEEACDSAHLDSVATMQVNLAVEEAVVNVMNYAYPPDTKGCVDVEAHICSDALFFVISDSGKPFDPTQQPEPDTSLGAEERGIGGLGIHLIRRYMDSVTYARSDNKNILTLTKILKDENNIQG